ncbi:hypothetical protein MRX96_016103 [Rhipicephalus microplus]
MHPSTPRWTFFNDRPDVSYTPSFTQTDITEQVRPLVVVEGAFCDDLSTKALDGCSHHAAIVEHASGQEKVAGSSSTTPNKWLASPREPVQLLAHHLYNDQSSHNAEFQVANCLASHGAVHEGSSQTQ